MRLPLAFAVLCASSLVHAQFVQVDSDHDGLSDGLEDALLQRFQPAFHISHADCSARPARFTPGVAAPTAAGDDGTIYGQAFPRQSGEIELHFYHLWRTDCGRLGHALDTEHVATLLRGRGTDAAGWKAVYWYAAAHEDTVCDAGQVTRASTLHAEDAGATVWISAGKHASYLNEELCKHGCGGDRCEHMESLKAPRIVNLGEATVPMNGSIWISSTQWPLREKMTRSDFRPVLLDRVDRLPNTDIAWAEPGKRPAQAAILGGNRGVDGALTGAAVGGSAAGHGIATGGRSTDTAISVAAGKTGNALSRSVHAVGHALGKSASKTGEAIGVKAKE